MGGWQDVNLVGEVYITRGGQLSKECELSNIMGIH